MATSNAYSLSTESFKMPSEPCPLPSLGSDEESFVVLWKDMDSKSIVEINHEPIGTSVVEEAKQLINKELSEIEQLSLTDSANRPQPRTETNLSVDGANNKNEKKLTETTDFDHSTILPKMPQVERGFDTSQLISIATLSTDLSSEQVQKKVSEIVDENIRLKDTILQNNISMKSQYERIVEWQEDVQKVHQTHKVKIVEAKEFIEKLKKENYNLVRELEQMRNCKIAQEEQILSLKQTLGEREQRSQEKLVKSTDNNIKEFELDIANNKMKELELAMKNLILENAALKENNVKLVNGNNKIEDYEKDISKLQTALNSSKEEVKQAKMQLEITKSLNEDKLKSMNDIIETLRSQLFFTNQEKTMLPSPEEVANIRQQLANTQVTLTQVDHSRALAVTQIENLNREIFELKAKRNESQANADEMYALKTQLDVYKADFEAEKNAKETIKNEKDKLTEDMQNLQRRNQQLQEEIDMLRENDYVVPPSQRRERETAPSAPSASNDHPFKCPVCNFGFKTHQALENHVYRCIELDDRLP